METRESRIKYLAVVAAVAASLVIGALWYSPLLFGRQWMALRGASATVATTMPAWKVLAELVRELVVP